MVQNYIVQISKPKHLCLFQQDKMKTHSCLFDNRCQSTFHWSFASVIKQSNNQISAKFWLLLFLLLASLPQLPCRNRAWFCKGKTPSFILVVLLKNLEHLLFCPSSCPSFCSVPWPSFSSPQVLSNHLHRKKNEGWSHIVWHSVFKRVFLCYFFLCVWIHRWMLLSI